MPLLFSLLNVAMATEVTVQAVDGQRAVVLVDDLVKGETPVVTDVDPGEVTLAFRDSMFGPVLFTQKVTVPADGSVTFTVNVAERSVDGGGAAAPAPAPAPKPAPAVAAKTSVEITADTDGLAIVLDGNKLSRKTPAVVEVDPGKHVITLKDGCRVGEKEFTADAGETTKVDVELEGEKVMVQIATKPEGATVSLEGQEMGTAPMEAKIRCGSRTFSAEAEGYRKVEKTIELGLEPMTITLELPIDAYGSLEVTVEPEGVIKLDGEQVGKNSVNLEKVGVGEHTLTVERNGVEVEKRTVTIKKDASAMLTLVVPEPAAVAPTKPVKPPKVKGERNGPSALRIVGNSVVTVSSVPLFVLGGYNYAQAVKALRQAEAAPDDATANEIVRTQVRPREILAYAEWGVGGALLLGGTTLWITSLVDDSGNVVVLPTPNGVQLHGRF